LEVLGAKNVYYYGVDAGDEVGGGSGIGEEEAVYFFEEVEELNKPNHSLPTNHLSLKQLHLLLSQLTHHHLKLPIHHHLFPNHMLFFCSFKPYHHYFFEF